MTAAAPWRRDGGPAVDREALRQAGEWFVRLHDDKASAADHAAWQRWFDACPAHQQAWQQVERVVRRFRTLEDPDAREAAEATLKTLRGNRMGRRQALKQLSVLLGVGTVGWLAWRHTPVGEQAKALVADHRTRVGEIAEVVLAEGTRVWLNTGSALNVDYGPGHRHLNLVRGEILVSTAADPHGRPLRVHTAHGGLEALGTRFSVRDEGGRSRLAVYEGAVAVHVRSRGAGRSVVEAGQQARFRTGAVAPARPAHPAEAAWTRGRLEADHRPLGELVAELARYRRGRLTVAPEVAHIPVMGTFPLTDTDGALTMLADALPVRVRRLLPWWVALEAL